MQRYKRVTFETRCQIRALLEINFSIREISRRLNYHRSTIYRELKRNRTGKVYEPRLATQLAANRFLRCRKGHLLNRPEIRALVLKGLEDGWSPDQIAGRTKVISRQTIYNAIHNFLPIWKEKLRRFGKRRGHGRWRGRRKGPEWMRTIHERPENANNRETFGHWERDTLFGKDRKTLVAFVERKSRYLRMDKVVEPYTDNLTEQTWKMFDGQRVLSFTNDRGNEFLDGYYYQHPVYYCDSRSPHQKGTIENTIGLVRQYITRKTDLATLSTDDVQAVADKLNSRPRRCLDYKTPNEVFLEETVALEG